MRLHYVRYGDHFDPIMILHGLFGSERNWTAVAKKLRDRYSVIIPDLRNHGQSPHHPEHSIESMRGDIEELADHLNLNRFFLLGHSMGGYVAMDYAFHHAERIAGLIVEDIAPRIYPNHNLLSIIDSMQSIDLNQLSDKKQVDDRLELSIQNPAVRQFLLTNLSRSGDQLSWRIHLPALRDFVSREFKPIDFDSRMRFSGKTLFIGGGKSPYRIWEDELLIRKCFPSVKIQFIHEADHWVHYDAFHPFCEAIVQFLQPPKPFNGE